MSKPNGEEHLIQIRYADTHEQKMLKQQTAAGRVFRAAEYEVGVAQARALGTPDRYDTVSTFLLKYLKLLLDFSAQILLDFSAQIFSNHFSNFLLKLFKSLLNLSIHVEGKSASRGGLALNGKQFAPSVLFNCSESSPNLRSERQDVESIDVAPPRTASSAYSLVDPTATALPQFPPPHATITRSVNELQSQSHGTAAYYQPGPSTYLSLDVLPPSGIHFGPSMFATGASWVVSCHRPNEERAR